MRFGAIHDEQHVQHAVVAGIQGSSPKRGFASTQGTSSKDLSVSLHSLPSENPYQHAGLVDEAEENAIENSVVTPMRLRELDCFVMFGSERRRPRVYRSIDRAVRMNSRRCHRLGRPGLRH